MYQSRTPNYCKNDADMRWGLDIQFGHVLFRYFDIPIPRPDRPALRRYYDGLTLRPAFREHVMLPYDDLRVTD